MREPVRLDRAMDVADDLVDVHDQVVDGSFNGTQAAFADAPVCQMPDGVGVLLVQCGPGLKLALRAGEEGFGCLSPVCGDCPFHIVIIIDERQASN